MTDNLTVSERKNAYQKFYEIHGSSIFQSPQWLDIVSQDWDVLLHQDKKQNFEAALPFTRGKLGPWITINSPVLTPHLGPIFDQSSLSDLKANLVIKNLISQLPVHPMIEFKLPISEPCISAFGWSGYHLHSRLTARLNLTSRDWETLKPKVRRNLQHAEREFDIQPDPELTFLQLWDRPFVKRNVPVYISKDRLDSMVPLIRNLPVKAWMAKDKDNRIISGVMILLDKNVAYYLVGLNENEVPHRGAHTLLLHTAIQSAYDEGLEYFDFEGSMLEGVMQFFMSFNASVFQYSIARKFKSKWHQLAYIWRRG